MNSESKLSSSTVVGIDIGGANIKLANSVGECLSCRFPLWIEYERLGSRISELLKRFGAIDRVAVTMTGELADCFATRKEGVRRIIEQTSLAFPARQTWVYALEGQWYTPEQAMADPWQVAASNWHALASWTARAFGKALESDSFLLVDVGSTTVDVIPVANRRSITEARTDRDRLQLGQLIYTGIERTPVAAIVRSLLVAGQVCPVMAERFATSDDAYVALSLTAQAPDDCDSADGRPRTLECARARLARMVGEDSTTLPLAIIEDLARQIVDAQSVQIAEAVERNISKYFPRSAEEVVVLASGHGKPLLESGLSRISRPTRVVWMEDLLSQGASRCAPAVAVAWLFEQERCSSVARPEVFRRA